MAKTINIDGVEYIEKPEYYQDREHVCVIADRGWIFEGHVDPEWDGDGIKMTDANVVRRWDNGLGIGGLADPEHKDDYTLDYIGDLHVYGRAVIAVIPLRW